MIIGVSNVPQPGNTYPCPRDGSEAKLIVSFSGRKPVYDAQKNRQYYCLVCQQRFSVTRTGQVIRQDALGSP